MSGKKLGETLCSFSVNILSADLKTPLLVPRLSQVTQMFMASVTFVTSDRKKRNQVHLFYRFAMEVKLCSKELACS